MQVLKPLAPARAPNPDLAHAPAPALIPVPPHPPPPAPAAPAVRAPPNSRQLLISSP